MNLEGRTHICRIMFQEERFEYPNSKLESSILVRNHWLKLWWLKPQQTFAYSKPDRTFVVFNQQYKRKHKPAQWQSTINSDSGLYRVLQTMLTTKLTNVEHRPDKSNPKSSRIPASPLMIPSFVPFSQLCTWVVNHFILSFLKGVLNFMSMINSQALLIYSNVHILQEGRRKKPSIVLLDQF